MMNDDIVTRLREHANGDFEKTSEFMLGLAADEIERLRLDVNMWRELVNAYKWSHSHLGELPEEVLRLRKELDNATAEIQRLRKLVGQSFMQVIFDEVYEGDLETANAEWDKLKEKRNG
jgi:hypothetical protein